MKSIISRVTLIALGFSAACVFGQTTKIPSTTPAMLDSAEPFHAVLGDIEPASSAFFELMDLTTPGLEKVRTAVSARDYVTALEYWRDAVVDRLRIWPAEKYDWRSQPSPKTLAIADYLMERLSESDYFAIWNNDPQYVDFHGLRSAPGSKRAANYALPLPTDPVANGRAVYGHFRYTPHFVAKWRETGDPAYIQKFFDLAVDFSLHHKRVIQSLPGWQLTGMPAEFDSRYFDNWSTRAPSALCQADRVQSFVRTLAGFAKSLSPSERQAPWVKTLQVLPAAPENWDRSLIPARSLAIVALSLTQDHPEALKALYFPNWPVTNQRFVGLYSLAVMIRCFPEFKAMKELRPELDAKIDDVLTVSLYPDGGMLEQSFNYNDLVAEIMKGMVSQLDGAGLRSVEKIPSRLKAYERMRFSLTVPTGYLPWKGTVCPALKGMPTLTASHRAQLENDLQNSFCSLFGSQASFPPEFTSVAFPYSGYYVLRDGWQPTSPYLFFTSARMAAGHRSNDVNGLQLNAFGRWLLVSAGPLAYNINHFDPDQRAEFADLNNYFEERSTRKENTILVDGLDQSQDHPYNHVVIEKEPIRARFHAGAAIDFVEGYHRSGWRSELVKYNPSAPAQITGQHHRQVFFIRNAGLWIVVDRVTGLDSAEHVVAQNWIIPPRIEDGTPMAMPGFRSADVVVDAGDCKVSTTDVDGANVFLRVAAPNTIELKRYEGQRHPYLGWFARGITGRRVPTPQIQAQQKGLGDRLFVTLISASPDRQDPVADWKLISRNDGAVEYIAALQSGDTLHVLAGLAVVTFCDGPLRTRATTALMLNHKDGSRAGMLLDGQQTTLADKPAELPAHAELILDAVGKCTLSPVNFPTQFNWQNIGASVAPRYQP